MADITPYVELLDSSEAAYVYIRDALNVWADCPGVTQAFCVMSAGMLNAGTVTKLKRDTGLDVHGGYKTHGSINKFTTPATAFGVMDNNVTNPLEPFLWENERALEFLSVNCESPDVARIHAAFTYELQTAGDGQAWMYLPEVLSDSDACPDRRGKSIALVDAIRCGFCGYEDRLRWIVGYWAKPGIAASSFQLWVKMANLVGGANMIPIASVSVAPNMSDPKRWWGVEELSTKLYAGDYAGGSQVAVIFTGYANFRSVADEWHRVTHQTQGAQSMTITSRAIRAKFPLNIRKAAITTPVAPPPAYIEVKHLEWASTSNGGGGQTVPLRQVGTKCIARVKLPVETEPYLCIPTIAVGTNYGPHGLEGANGHECQAMGAMFDDALAPLTLHKRTMCEPKMIGPAEMGVWLDFEIPMLAYSEPEAIISVNLLLCRVLP